MSKKVIKKIYEEDWAMFDGPQHIEKFREAINHPQFKRLDLDVTCDDYNGNEFDITIIIERDETEEEKKERYRKTKIRKDAIAKSAKTRAIKREAESQQREVDEKELYEKLKKKYENI